MRHVAILGSTGSIGQNAVQVALEHVDTFKVVALSARRSIDALALQIEQLFPELVAVADESARRELEQLLTKRGYDFKRNPLEIVIGEDGLLAVATIPSADVLLIALVGSAGLRPLLPAIEAGKDIAFVNKEAMVMAGPLVMDAVKRAGVQLIPVDSEHSAIFQCLMGESMTSVEKLILTSSGGPFRTWDAERMSRATVAEAVNHPRWSMGAKISVDSATLMNKGLEIIEARWLFGVSLEQIEVLIHPESIIHSMVQFVDGSIKAHLGDSDMRMAILYGLSYPQRLNLSVDRLDFAKLKALTFEAPDETRFRGLALAKQACLREGSAPAVLNAANEIAVEAFLAGEICFAQIVELVEDVLAGHVVQAHYDLEEIIAIDAQARCLSKEWVLSKSKRGVLC